MKKVLASVLSAMMLVTALSACAKPSSTPASTPAGSTPASTPAVNADTAEFVELQMYFHGSNVSDDKAVLEKVNAILKDKLNCSLKPIWGTWGDYDEKAMNAINGSDPIDLYFTASWGTVEYNSMARRGAFIRLDNENDNLIEKYASNLWGQLPEVLKTGARVNGAEGVGVYAIPNYKDCATQLCWDVNGTLLKELGYTADNVKAIDFYSQEFFDMLKKAKDTKGKDFYPLLIEGAVLERMVNNTILVTGDMGDLNLLSYYFDPQDPSKDLGNKIVNKFATPEFEKYAKRVRELYQAGFIDPSMASPQLANDKRTETQKSGKYLFGTQSYALGCETQYSVERSIEVMMVPSSPAYVDTTSSQGAMFAVSVTSKNPERAVMLLNEINTNPELFQLLAYGVEDVQYKKVGDGTVELIKEGRDVYSPWLNGVGSVAIPGNLMPFKADGPDFYDKFRAYYTAAKSVPNLTFAMDTTPVFNEGSACVSAAKEFMLPLCTGSVDPATELPKMLKALTDNGVEKFVAEANTQMEACLAAK